MSNLDKVVHEARGTSKGRAKEAGRAVGKALQEHNDNVKKKQERDFDNEISEISKYHLKRVLRNRTYHFIGR